MDTKEGIDPNEVHLN